MPLRILDWLLTWHSRWAYRRRTSTGDLATGTSTQESNPYPLW
jgi:hypothetical protein